MFPVSLSTADEKQMSVQGFQDEGEKKREMCYWNCGEKKNTLGLRKKIVPNSDQP